MINLTSIDYQTVRSNIDNYIKNNGFYDSLLESISSATYNQILDILTQYVVYDNYKYNLYRQESYINEAQLDTSVINLASMLGYRLNRPTAPRIKIRYIGTETVYLQDGMILGSYIDYDIVYFGYPKKYEYGDEFDLYLGKFNELVEYVQTDYIVEKLIPLILQSIDNRAVHLYVNDIFTPISHSIEDYVIFQSPVDYSIDFNSTQLYIMDKQNYYGLTLKNGDKLRICWMETNGEEIIDPTKINLDNNYIYVEISSNGTNGDDIEKVRFLAPLYFTTLRRMVTKQDHEYIIKAHELIKDCAVTKVETQPLEAYLYPTGVIQNQTYNIKILDNEYTVTTDEKDTYDTTLTKIYNTIASDKNIVCSIDTNTNTIKIIQSNLDVCDFPIEVSNNLILSIEKPFVKAPCCTLNCYYIKYNTTNDPIYLTGSEQLELSKYISLYKLVGTSVILIPAQKEEHNLNIKVSIIDNNYVDYVKEKIQEIISEYELHLNKEFKYGEFLSKVANITYIDNEKIKNIIDYVAPNQEMFDLPAKPDTYYKFNLNVEFI